MLLSGARVLVVDAEARALLSLMRPLMREGAHVDGVSTGREAFMLARRRPFDVVITGLGLPDTSGDVLVRAIRAVSGQTCIVVVTGASEALSTRARDVGADRIFSKPTDWRSVLAYLRNRELTRAA
jgi:DNA-binding response OmpR family regulator